MCWFYFNFWHNYQKLAISMQGPISTFTMFEDFDNTFSRRLEGAGNKKGSNFILVYRILKNSTNFWDFVNHNTRWFSFNGRCQCLFKFLDFIVKPDSYIYSGVITDGDIGESPMVKWMGNIRELFADSRCHFNKKL